MMDSPGLDFRRMIEEASRRLNELVPPDVSTHLLRAQKELVLALTAMIEHGGQGSAPAPRGSRGRATSRSGSRSGARTRRPRPVTVD